MLSCRSDSPLVMNRLTPSMFQVPSSFGVALVRPAPTSEPASGSVSTMVVPHSRSTMSWAIAWSRSLPLRWMTPAKAGPQPYIQMGALEPSTISAIAQLRRGRRVGAAELLLDLECASTRRPSRRGSSS